MSGIEKRTIGELAKMIFKLANHEELDESEMRYLDNIIRIYCKED